MQQAGEEQLVGVLEADGRADGLREHRSGDRMLPEALRDQAARTGVREVLDGQYRRRRVPQPRSPPNAAAT